MIFREEFSALREGFVIGKVLGMLAVKALEWALKLLDFIFNLFKAKAKANGATEGVFAKPNLEPPPKYKKS